MTSLCEHCSLIDFEFLRAPIVKDLHRINEGEDDVHGHYFPFKADTSDRLGATWRLGKQDRITTSAASCQFCATIVKVLADSNLPTINPELFNVNPMCEARIYWCARLSPPIGGISYSRKDEGISYRKKDGTSLPIFYLRRISLRWIEPTGTLQDIGEVLSETDSSNGSSALLGSALQPCDENSCLDSAGLFDDERLKANQTIFSGRRRPPIIDARLPKRWLAECLENHGDSCHVVDSGGPERVSMDFRLIDVERMALVEIPNANLKIITYAALSYIWGSRQRLELKGGNRDSLKEPGALTGRVSKTIEDAIAFTRMLGLPYIWVDALCILQDSSGDKMVHIGVMSTIYKYAEVTIVAGAGSDAGAGLPGLFTPRPAGQHEVLVKEATDGKPAIRLMSTLNPQREHWGHYAEDLVWSKRGWTLQEKVLSRRTLTFTNTQLFWSCRRCQWWEETLLETDLAKTHWYSIAEREFVLDPRVLQSFVDAADADGQTWYQLRRLARDYGTRSLTVQGDAYDAFVAVLQECEALINEPFLWGLPASARFELALCWEPFREGLVRRNGVTTLPMTSLNCKVPFPSWSWIGWKGSVNLRLEDRHAEEGIEPQISCYVLRNSPLRLVRVSRLAADVPGRSPPAFLAQALLQSPSAVTLEKIVSNLEGLDTSSLARFPDDQLLFFWSESSFFRLSVPIEKNMRTDQGVYHVRYFDILDRTGKVVGRTEACQPLEKGDSSSSDQEFEFVLLADNRPQGYGAKKIVLQISRQENGDITERANIAEIEDDAWTASGPIRKLIALR